MIDRLPLISIKTSCHVLSAALMPSAGNVSLDDTPPGRDHGPTFCL
jgi:hypothetical protein